MKDIRKYFTIMANDAGQEAYRDSYVHEIERSNAALAAEVAELKGKLAEYRRKGKWTYCAYCGAEFPLDNDGSDVAKHIATCDKHPMRKSEQELTRLQGLVERAVPAVESILKLQCPMPHEIFEAGREYWQKWLKDAEQEKGGKHE